MAKSVVINDVTYANCPSVQIPLAGGGGNATFYDPDDATAAQAEILASKTAYINGGLKTGSMPNNGATGGNISTKDGTVSIPSGYTSGGSVGIDSTAKASIISDNILASASILGVNGNQNNLNTTISSGAASAGDIIAGKKAYANGSLITGTATVPTVSQDSITKVLTIQ